MLEVNIEVQRGETLLAYDFQLESGQCLWLSGRSGSGKTSLLEAIAGFIPIASGDIRLSDRSVSTLLPEQRPISSQFQSGNLLDHLDVKTNITLALNAAETQVADIEALLHRLGLDNILHRRPTELSGGMRQRVALARNLLRQRAITLLDEPFSALDDANRQKAITEIEAAASKGRYFIVASHQLDGLEHWKKYQLD